MKVGCTRLIPLTHRGQCAFTNTVAYGEHFDTQYVNESTLPTKDDGEFIFPEDVDGWLTSWEGRKLSEIAKGKRVLELGSYCGRSTICIAQTAEHVVSIDPHDGRGTPYRQNTFDSFKANLQRYGIANVEAYQTTDFSDDHDKFDLVFIDAAHDYESVSKDIVRASSVLNDGGLLAFHDYRSVRDPGVTQAVDELLANGGEMISTTDSLAVVRPPAAVLMEI